jgi:polysaccharide export outer membrane protein
MRVTFFSIVLTMMMLVVVFTPLFPGAQAKDPSRADLDTVMELMEGWKEKIERGGLKAYVTRYGNPYRGVEKLNGKKGYAGRVSMSIEDVSFFNRDDGIITTTFFRRASAGKFTDVGVGMLSFEREDGSWRIAEEKWYPLPEHHDQGEKAYTVTIGPGNQPRVIIDKSRVKAQKTPRDPPQRVNAQKKSNNTPQRETVAQKAESGNPEIGEYAIGAGDILSISVWGHEDLTKEVVVSEKGRFSFPLIGEVAATGLTSTQLEAKLVRLLSNGYVINPNVTVRIQGYKSQRVYVLGEVRSPGTYSLDKETSLIEIISRAGGVGNDAGWIIEVVRPSRKGLGKPVTPDEANREEIIRVDVEGLLGGRPADNIRIEGGDTIFIPKAAYYFIFGEVKTPGSYKLRRDTTVLKAVILAGGFTEKASKRRIKIRRKEEEKTIKVRVKLDDPVLPGDTIIVPESFF